MTLGAECGDQAAVHRLAVHQHRTGAAVAGVAALFHAEMPKVPQQRAQALAGTRMRGKILAIDLEAITAARPAVQHGFLRRGAASCACATPACHGRRGDKVLRGFDRRIASRNSFGCGIRQRTIDRPHRRCRHGQGEGAIAADVPISKAADRPAGVSDIWRKAERRFRAANGTSICRSRSPGASTLLWFPVTKSATSIAPFGTVGMPDRADAVERAVSEIIGPAGSDMQRLPPTVAVFQILKDARNARQHWLISGAAIHSGGQTSASNCAMVQVAAISAGSADLRAPAI